MEAVLPLRPPFDGTLLLGFLAQRAVPAVEEVADDCYRRTVRLPHAAGIVEVAIPPGSAAISLRAYGLDARDWEQVERSCRRVFDLDADPAAIHAVLGADPLLAPLVEARPGLRVPRAFEAFEMAVRAVLGQQVSVAGARTLAGRLVAALGEPLPAPRGRLTHLFPTAQRIAGADLSGLGLTRSRAATLQRLAAAVAGDGLLLDPTADREQTQARLLALPGIGPWTASYVAMRALADPDALPAGDLGLRRALERRGLAANAKSIITQAEAWRPWRSYATMHLWMSLSDPE
jgi:AraC family transcriptional regulator of adaptative response / DNA-3-methyladenine glycosylase II